MTGPSGRAGLRVLFLPDFSANPYQRRLADALGHLGVEVSMHRAPRRDPLPILRAWLMHGRPGVVHLHWTHNYLGMSSEADASGNGSHPSRIAVARFTWQLRLLRTLRVRLIWTVHNVGHHESSPGGGSETEAHRRLVAVSHAVICHCQAAEAAVSDAYGLTQKERARLHVIPHGNYVGAYGEAVERAAARDRLGLPQDANVFLFLGAVRAYKGVGELLTAFGRLADPNARLVIAGKPHSDELAADLASAAAADPRVLLRLGFVPDAEMAILLGAANVVVAPFSAVLTSGSVILAMSYGRAVVAPSLGCLPETLDDEVAVLYDPTTPQALSDALQKALTSDLDAMGSHNLEIANRLAWGPIAAATRALYER